MAIKIYFRRFTSLLLCGLLVFCSLPVQVHATDPVTAASLAITGGQLAGAGLSGEAALSLAGPVGAVVGLSLGALGVNAYVSKAAQNAGKTRTRFVLDKLVIWGAQAGYAQDQLYSKIAQGISVAADGTIQLGKETAQMIEQFGNWLFTQDAVVESPGSSTGDSFTQTIGDVIIPLKTTWAFTDASGKELTIISSNNPIFVDMPAGSHSSRVFSFVSGTTCQRLYKASPTSDARVQDLTLSSSALSQSAALVYYTNFAKSSFNDYYKVNYPDTFPTFYNYWTSLETDFVYNPSPDAQASDEVFVGTPEQWVQGSDVLNPAADGTPIVLNPDLLNSIIDSLADGQQATMSIIDYLQALQDAWDHALDDVQTAIGTITDQLTGIQEQIAIPQDAVKNPTVTNPSVTPETTPVLDPSAVDPETAVTGLSFDLTQIFPFCIPFDIYAMLATLSATPEAPVYHVHYEGPYNIVIDFTVDLSPWNSVAAVLRTVELLAFCIGLAYVTRSMFIRS